MTRRMGVAAALLIVAAIVAVLASRQREEVPAAVEPPIPAHAPGSGGDGPSAANVHPSVTGRIRELNDRIATGDSSDGTLLELARILQDAHREREAAVWYGLLLEKSPGSISARIDYAQVLASLGRDGDALVQTRMVLARDPGHPAALYNAGALHANMGRPDSAVRYWKKLVALHPDDTLAAKARQNLPLLGTGDGTGAARR